MRRPDAFAGIVLLGLSRSRQDRFCSPASRSALQQVSVVKQSVKHGTDRGGISQQLAPVFHRPVRGDQGTGSLVAAHDNFEKFFGSRQGQLAHAEIVENKQRHRHQRLQAFLAGAVESRFGEFIQQGVSFAVENTVTLLDHGLADGLRQVAFTRAGRP
jgi:hypothetical protein